MSEFPGLTLSTADELAVLYRAPSEFVRNKKHVGFDEATRAFVAATRLAFVASVDGSGGVDVSPRGGDTGFIRIIEHSGHEFLAIPDLNGNNLIDTLSNVVASGRAATILVIPGHDDTLRVNGAAAISTESAILDLFTEVRRPKTAILVRADEVYVHCAKAFRRSETWQPATWGDGAPDLADIVRSQGLTDADADVIRVDIEAGYVEDLAADRR